MKLTAENVETVLMDCFYKNGEDTSNHILAEGVMMKAGFNPIKIEKHKQDIADMLNDLPKEFMETGGGGYSFLQACLTSDGEQWGEHRNIDNLLCLGIAAGKVRVQLPREMWAAFPGGMPHFVVLNKEQKPERSVATKMP